MMIRFSSGLLLVTLCMPLIGCGQSKEATVIYDETEMAKYRSTPEQIAAGMKGAGAGKKPTAAELKAMEAQAKQSAAVRAAATNNN